MRPTAFCALLVSPRYVSSNIMMWQKLCESLGFRYMTPPLGLLTVAALLPRSWEIRLIDRNFEELTAEDLEQADIVMTGGMLTQQRDTLEIIRLAQALGKPVVVGGPDVTSSPHVYAHADFQVRGEAEDVIDEFLVAWNAGARRGAFEAEKFQVDLTRSPVPRYDLVRSGTYLHCAVQFSRGCPFTCEFCDIIELYGRVPRTKTPEQMLSELDALYRLGFRGPVCFVDDNLIGNKRELRRFLPLLKDWQEARGYPFEFSTQATVNLGDDAELLRLMSQANFVFVFLGIESPDPTTLILTKKKQNAIRDLSQAVANIHAAGIFVSAGIVIGFDGESGPVAEGIIEFFRAAPVPVVYVGLLLALPNTQLCRRLASEGRLHPHAELSPDGDQSTCGLNFDTIRPRRDVLTDYVTVLDALYAPSAYFSRLRSQCLAVKRPKLDIRMSRGTSFRIMIRLARVFWKMTVDDREVRSEFWYTMLHCAQMNIDGLKYAIATAAVYLDYGPLARAFSDQMREHIDLIDRGEWQPPSRGLPATASSSVVRSAQMGDRIRVS